MEVDRFWELTTAAAFYWARRRSGFDNANYCVLYERFMFHDGTNSRTSIFIFHIYLVNNLDCLAEYSCRHLTAPASVFLAIMRWNACCSIGWDYCSFWRNHCQLFGLFSMGSWNITTWVVKMIENQFAWIFDIATHLGIIKNSMSDAWMSKTEVFRYNSINDGQLHGITNNYIVIIALFRFSMNAV